MSDDLHSGAATAPANNLNAILIQNRPPMANGARADLHGIAVTHLRSSDGASAIIADHGAHLLSWCPAGGAEALYLSPTSRYGGREAIRGGVPVIFPQFGEQGPGKRHGIARVRPWTLISVSLEEGAAVACLALQGQLDGRDGGVDEYRLTLEVRLQGDALQLGLTIDNVGNAPWTCQAALHTYLRVAALNACGVSGLQGCGLRDQVADGAASTQTDAMLGFAAEVDRIYPNAPSPLLLRDGQRCISVAQQGFADTVVWNPGAAKAAALTDLPASGFREFICIEAAAIVRQLMLEPGDRWYASQTLKVLSQDP